VVVIVPALGREGEKEYFMQVPHKGKKSERGKEISRAFGCFG
jgi:hypothetical protein